MSLSENQRIGKLAELDVENLFTSWGWLVGHDHIDDGYDFFITPHQSQFKGARFLAQVKGTARKKGKAIVARVSKKRLRQYAENPIPVVIIRSTADRTLYWIHAQQWAKENSHKLSGNGESGVRIEKASLLTDRNEFEVFLKGVLEPQATRPGALAKLAEERSRYLSSLDARLCVRTNVQDGREQHTIFAASEKVDATFHFQPSPTLQNLETLRETIEFGLPGEVQVDEFGLAGSPVFEAIGASDRLRGKISVRPTHSDKGFIEIRPGSKYSIFAPDLSIPAELFRGQKGAAISNQSIDSLLEVSVKLVSEGGRGRANFVIGFRPGTLSEKPIQSLKELTSMLPWADAVLSEEAMFIELVFRGVRAPLSVSDGSLRSLNPFLGYARILGMLHLIARSSDSNFVMPEDHDFSASDVSDIELAFALLKGERRPIGLGPIEFETNEVPELTGNREFFMTTTLSLALGGQPLANIPVAIGLPGFVVEERSSPTKLRLSKGEHGQAWISYAEHDIVDGAVKRMEEE